MSSVAEMNALVREAADHTSASPNWKERVQAAARVLKLPFGRAKRHYYGEARRADVEEIDHAREAVQRLRDAREQRKVAEHVQWLECEIARHRAAGTEFRGAHVHALEHVLRMARGEAGALGVQPDHHDATDPKIQP